VASRFPCHVTLKVRPGVPSLRKARVVREVEGSFSALLAQGRTHFRVVHYSLQGDHAHLIVEAPDAPALGRGMKAVGARIARAVNRVFGTKGRVLADRYHLRVPQTPREVRNAIRYVLLNARRHGCGPRSRGCLDPASSARWFDGWRKPSTGSSNRAVGRPPVARARTWMLRMGWRRHGLIDPGDVPGRRG
jgi:hypothetical protein